MGSESLRELIGGIEAATGIGSSFEEEREMSDKKQMALLNATQRLDLANQILQLMEAKYPESEFMGHEEALIIALQATTGASWVQNLFNGAR